MKDQEQSNGLCLLLIESIRYEQNSRTFASQPATVLDDGDRRGWLGASCVIAGAVVPVIEFTKQASHRKVVLP